ncbi:MAG: 50S ribosomal protein L18 [Candidatus Micrarchaeota archaeon]|nr:50S ribosomal protein L18 [Candidatus Micrarchaeota archaeon]
MGQATGPSYKVAFRRRRENLTNYAKRLALVKGAAPRMVVRKSGRGILVQFVSFGMKGDEVIASAHSSVLSKFGWAPRCNAPTAYLCGLLAAKSAAAKGVKAFNLDIGMQTPSKGSVVFAALKGAKDAGLSTSYPEEMISEERISGSAIAKYALELKSSNPEKYSRLFSAYLKQNFAPEKIEEAFRQAKEKISRL